MSKAFSGAPQFVRFLGPVLDALQQLGGSGRPDEVRSAIAKNLELTEAEQTEELAGGSQPRFNNQVHWARFYLAQAELLDSSTRGVWALTERGLTAIPMSDDEARRVFKKVAAANAKAKADKASISPVEPSSDQADAILPSEDYRAEVTGRLQSLSAAGFERFCQRLLRESGFQEVTVTGKSGDGGIDGIGILQVNALVSFKVLFQCKRYAGSVAVAQVRDFRGAMMGRADKGIILTTGTFTSEARKEAIRDGAPQIELVDREKLIEMLEQLELGLKPRTTYEIDAGFFEGFH